MTEGGERTGLDKIIELGKCDVLLAGLGFDKKRITEDLAGRSKAIEQNESRQKMRQQTLTERKAVVTREEKSIRGERDRLTERRKSLSAVNNYKVQQAAEREIEFISKQVSQREEALLSVMREVELLEKDVADLMTAIETARADLESVKGDADERLKVIEERMAEYEQERQGLLASVGQHPGLALYNRSRSRYPMDPIVSIANRDSCAGCHMKLGPQVVVQASRGEVIKCPGCSRILRLEEKSQDAA